MKLTTCRPVSLHRQFDRLFSGWSLPETGWHPAIDIHENESDLVVVADLPGMTAEDVKIHVKEDVLAITGAKKRQEQTEDNTYYRIERSYGSFERSFSLPSKIDTDKISAAFGNGVLTITLPKVEEVKAREIPVSVS